MKKEEPVLHYVHTKEVYEPIVFENLRKQHDDLVTSGLVTLSERPPDDKMHLYKKVKITETPKPNIKIEKEKEYFMLENGKYRLIAFPGKAFAKCLWGIMQDNNLKKTPSELSHFAEKHFDVDRKSLYNRLREVSKGELKASYSDKQREQLEKVILTIIAHKQAQNV